MLALHGLRYAWSDSTSLAFPDFEAPQGAHVIVRGRSGSGKSTLLALIAGLLTPSAGHITVAGTAVHTLGRRALDAWRGATLGFVPQRLHLSESLSVQANLALPYVACGAAVDPTRIAQLLDRLGLASLAARRPHELSAGQAQRVALARALARRPALLVADEPTAHLDDDSTAAVLALLAEAADEQGATLVVATHDARVSARLAGALELALA